MDCDLRPLVHRNKKETAVRALRVDAFIIRRFNLSDASRPVTVAGVN